MEQLVPALKGLHSQMSAPMHPEVALLSTCNRTELYCAAGGLGHGHTLQRSAVEWLSGIGACLPTN